MVEFPSSSPSHTVFLGIEMKIFKFALIALFAFSTISITGCGGGAGGVVEPDASVEDTGGNGMTADEQDDYDAAMAEMDQEGN